MSKKNISISMVKNWFTNRFSLITKILIFLILVVISFIVQLIPVPLLKMWLSPILPLFVAVAYMFATIKYKDNGYILIAIGLIFLFLSDFLFERQIIYPELFILALIAALISGLVLGISFIFLSVKTRDLNTQFYLIAFAISTFASIGAFLLVKSEGMMMIIVGIYAIHLLILLTGGILSFKVGSKQYGMWAILLFISDTFVGIRAFGSTISFIQVSTVLILLVYYPALIILLSNTSKKSQNFSDSTKSISS